jgi:HEAT repeat protein
MPNDFYGHIHNELWEEVVAGGYAARARQVGSHGTIPNSPVEPAVVALRKMGTNAIPRLLELVSAQPDVVERWSAQLSQKLPVLGPVIYRYGPIERAAALRIAGWRGFCALGTNAEPALPALERLLRSPARDLLLACAIGQIGPRGNEVLVAALDSPDSNTVESSAFALGWGLDPAEKISAVRGLVNVVERGRAGYHVMGALGRLGGSPELVVPALTRWLEQSSQQLKAGLELPMAILILGLYGEQARSAVPVLVKLHEDPDKTIRQVTRVALKQIDPVHVAARLGRSPDSKDDADPWWGGPVD